MGRALRHRLDLHRHARTDKTQGLEGEGLGLGEFLSLLSLFLLNDVCEFRNTSHKAEAVDRARVFKHRRVTVFSARAAPARAIAAASTVAANAAAGATTTRRRRRTRGGTTSVIAIARVTMRGCSGGGGGGVDDEPRADESRHDAHGGLFVGAKGSLLPRGEPVDSVLAQKTVAVSRTGERPEPNAPVAHVDVLLQLRSHKQI